MTGTFAAVGSLQRYGQRNGSMSRNLRGLNPLNRATWSLLNRTTGELAPGVVSGAGTMGSIFDATGTRVERPHNLLSFSEQFDNAAWAKTGATVVADAVAGPFGQMTADRLVESATTGAHSVGQSPIAVFAGVLYTTSFYVRAGERTRIACWHSGAIPFSAATFDLSTGTKLSGPGSIENVGGGWYRINRQDTATSTGSTQVVIAMADAAGNASYAGNGTSGIFVSGAQLNLGTLQPYYPTTGAPFFGPRVSWDPANLAAGPMLLIRGGRTNRIRNNTGQGVGVGIPGTAPLFWNISGASNGLQRDIRGVFTVAGMPMLRLRIFGTATATSAFSIWAEGTVGQVTATPGQLVTNSLFTRVVDGGTTGLRMGVQEFDSASAFLRGPELPVAVSGSLTRHLQPVTIGANTASVRSGCFVAYTNGQEVDVTLDIGVPELSLGDIQSWEPPILTYGAEATVSDVVTVPTAGTGFTNADCTLYVDWLCPVNTRDDNHLITLDNNGGLPTIALRIGNNAGRRVRGYAQSAGGSFEYALDAPVNASATSGRSAMSFRLTNDCRVADAGALSPLDSVGSIVGFNINRITLGRNGAASAPIVGIRQANIVMSRVSDSSLQRMVR
jgi:hypothetical protein